MASSPIHPLRLYQGSNNRTPSPKKKAPSVAGNASLPRPLSELSSSSPRRNSPSFDQNTKKPISNRESSPFQSSPFNVSDGNSSPRLLWQGRTTPTKFKSENGPFSPRGGSPSPTRRSSIEKLQKASRVKNSTMFAREQKQEYDPTHTPVIERPLAKQVQGNAYGGSGIQGLRSNERKQEWGHRRTESQNTVISSSPVKTPVKSDFATDLSRSPSKAQASPTKSSLSNSRFNGKASFDHESGTWSPNNSITEKRLPDGRSLHRHAKSVTFDAAPPQVNEYEMATPDVSSIGTIGSRENSYDEDEEDEDDDEGYILNYGDELSQDESFDATLDDAPVVGPDEWRHHTPEHSPEDMYDPFTETYGDGPEGSPLPEAGPSSPQVQRAMSRSGSGRKDSVDSTGSSSRPLPPLPGFMQTRELSATPPSGGPSALAERMNSTPRSLPSPPSASGYSKSDFNGQMPLDERLKLMMIQDEKPAKTEAELQRERRLRRGNPFTRKDGNQVADPDVSHQTEEDDTLGDLSLGDYQLPPRISRESILRKVKGQGEFEREDYSFSSPPPVSPGQNQESRLPLDPDVPIPSTEDGYDDDDDDTGSVIIKPEPEDDEADLYSITEAYRQDETHEELPHQDSNRQETSPLFQSNSATEDEGPPTPRARSPLPLLDSPFQERTKPEKRASALPEFQGFLGESRALESPFQEPTKHEKRTSALPEFQGFLGESRALFESEPTKHEKRSSALPEFQGFLGESRDFGLGMEAYMTPSPPLAPEKDILDPVEDERVSREATLESEESESLYEERMSAQPEFIEPEFLKKARLERSQPEPEPERESEEVSPVESDNRPVTPEQRKFQPQPRPEYDGTGWGSDEELEDGEEPGTPDSVIRHPRPPLESPARNSPIIPEQVATIKSSAGSKLKTRPSATPADLQAMRDQRRQVSGQLPAIPPIPERNHSRPSNDEPGAAENESEAARKSSFAKRSLTLDLENDFSFSSSLDKDFDRVVESQKVAFAPHSTAPNSFGLGSISESHSVHNFELTANITPRKQRGYLMRQNTKMVVATSSNDFDDHLRAGTRSTGNSPAKAIRPQSWTVEPWNGRKKSLRESSTSRRNKHLSGPVPPLPGQESNVAGLGSLPEGSAAFESQPLEEIGDRGRLFVKVIGVKELDLPLPKNERTWFCLTLDNGVHCVTTAWLELSRNAPIGQEFELVVPNELEFQLTLNVKLEKPAPKRVVESPTKQAKAQKSSTFSRVFASPRKRKEMEAKMREEEQRKEQQKEREAAAKKASAIPTAWDLLSPLAAQDGSFGRSYICLKDHEKSCYGRPYVVDVACFNEWATEEVPSSVKSKRSTHVVQARPPYKVGKLELQLLFVPKPRGCRDEDMPKSMNSCIREMQAAQATACRQHEGHLSQQGGDCPYWRRRFFKLDGVKLTAYHESTMQPRATINLSKAVKLIDDRTALTQKETLGKNGARRRSGFAEEEEGYMFVEEGFRIRFQNGELLDFYADSTRDKEGWMKALGSVIGKQAGKVGGWTDLVLRREEAERDREMRRKVSAGSGSGGGGGHGHGNHGREKREREKKSRSMIV